MRYLVFHEGVTLVELRLYTTEETLDLQLPSSLWFCGIVSPLLWLFCETCGFVCFLRLMYIYLGIYILLFGNSFLRMSYAAF